LNSKKYSNINLGKLNLLTQEVHLAMILLGINRQPLFTSLPNLKGTFADKLEYR